MMNSAHLLRNRKGADYSAFLVIIVFISVIYLFIQLYGKISVFELSVGDQELALMNAYASGDDILLFTDQAARYSAYQAVSDVARNGGFIFESEPCGNVAPDVRQRILFRYPFWFKEGKKCYPESAYTSFKHYLSKNLDSFLEKSPYSVYGENFEFTVAEDRVIGVALKPVLVPVAVSPEKKLFYGEVISKVFSEFGVAGLGVYSVRPSFSVDLNTHLENYDILFQKTDVLLDCLKADTIQNCVNSVSSNDLSWYFTEIPNSNIIAFDVAFNNLKNPYIKDKIFARFALEAGSVKKVERKVIFIPINWNLGEVEFIKAANAQYDYFLSLITDKAEKEKFKKMVFFDNLDYTFGGGQMAVPQVEAKVKKYHKSYDKNNDFIVGLIPAMSKENILGHVWGQDNIVLVKHDSINTLAHELGHAIWGFCDEYVYLGISCQDAGFETQFRNEILANPGAFLELYEKVQNSEIELDTFVIALRKSGFTEAFLNNLQTCDVAGWLQQNYSSKFGPCINPYPACCVDSLYYLGDSNAHGVNCIPDVLMSTEEKKAELCAGASCGPSCRSIMGLEFPGITTRKYPS